MRPGTTRRPRVDAAAVSPTTSCSASMTSSASRTRRSIRAGAAKLRPPQVQVFGGAVQPSIEWGRPQASRLPSSVKVRRTRVGVHLFDVATGLNVLLDEVSVDPQEWDHAPRQVSIALTNPCDLA